LIFRGDILLFAANEAPNFVTLNPFAIQIAENLVLIRRAGRAKFNQQLLNRSAMRSGHARRCPERIALNQTGNYAYLFFFAQFIHGFIMLDSSSIVK
jgi:hypothetical protein